MKDPAILAIEFVKKIGKPKSKEPEKNDIDGLEDAAKEALEAIKNDSPDDFLNAIKSIIYQCAVKEEKEVEE